MGLSIRVKLILAIYLPLLAVYAGTLAVEYRRGRAEIIEHVKDLAVERAAHQAQVLDLHLQIYEQQAESLANVISRAITVSNFGPAAPQPASQPAAASQPAPPHLAALPPPPGAPAFARPGAATKPDTLRRIFYSSGLIKENLWRNPDVYGSGVAFEPNAFPADAVPASPYVFKSEIPVYAPGPKGRRDPTRKPPPKEFVREVDISKGPGNYRQQDWYVNAATSGTGVWSDPIVKPGQKPLLRFSCPIKVNETLTGVSYLDVDLGAIQKQVAAVCVDGGGYSVLVGNNGTILWHPTEAFALKETLAGMARKHNNAPLEGIAQRMAAGQAGVELAPNLDGKTTEWVAYAPVPSTNWSYAAFIPESHIMAPVYERLGRSMALLSIGLLLIILLIHWTSRRVTRPIGRLAAAVRQLGDGNLNIPAIDTNSKDEIGVLARSFNSMVKDLRDHVEALTRETAARETVESELRIAREIQESLLPSAFPSNASFELYGMNSPAEHVAGDFFDFFYTSDHVLTLVIADVSGKGIPAAIFMAVTRTIIRNLGATNLTPAEILTRANAMLGQDNVRSMFVTLFMGHYDTRTGTLQYCNGGHCPPCIISAKGEVKTLSRVTGTILGAFEDQRFELDQVTLEKGDTLMLYTDGVTEACRGDVELFGRERLEAFLAQHAGDSMVDLCHATEKVVDEHRNHELQDDVTILAIRRIS